MLALSLHFWAFLLLDPFFFRVMLRQLTKLCPGSHLYTLQQNAHGTQEHTIDLQACVCLCVLLCEHVYESGSAHDKLREAAQEEQRQGSGS